AAGPVAAVGAGGQAQQQQPGPRVAEARHGRSPVLLVPIRAPLLARHLLPVLRQPRTTAAGRQRRRIRIERRLHRPWNITPRVSARRPEGLGSASRFGACHWAGPRYGSVGRSGAAAKLGPVPGPRIVLVRTKDSANVGAAARAMRNFGLDDLWLVAPRCRIDERARALASHAGDLLESAQLVDTLDEALVGITLVAGTSARPRRAPSYAVTGPREAAPKLLTNAAVLFGPEDHGLANEEQIGRASCR